MQHAALAHHRSGLDHTQGTDGGVGRDLRSTAALQQRLMDSDGTWPAENMKRLGEIGVLGMAVPEERAATSGAAEISVGGGQRAASGQTQRHTPEWVAAGYEEKFITNYLASQSNSYNHPNAAIEPRIPGIFQYYSVAEDELAKIYAGQMTAQAGADAIAAAWEKITDQLGRENQIKLYKASLGM